MLLAYFLEASGLHAGRLVIDSALGSAEHEVLIDAPADLRKPASTSPEHRVRMTLEPEVVLDPDPIAPKVSYVFPLRVQGRCLGIIHLYDSDTQGLDSNAMGVLQGIADVASTVIDQTHRLNQAFTLVHQLQGALDSRVVIEQAKGIIAARENSDLRDAFQLIRSWSREQQKPLRLVASEIVERHQGMHRSSMNGRW